MVLRAAVLLLALPAWAQSDPTLPPLFPAPPVEHHSDGTEVHFLAYRGEDQYAVTVGNQSCETPCTLTLRPGPTKVHLVGPGEADVQLVVPHLTAQVRVHTGPPSWYQVAGIVLIPTGIVVGVSMWALGLTCGFGRNSDPCIQINFIAWPVLGVAMLITGSVLLGIYNRTQPWDANRAEILDARRRRRPRLDELALAFLRDGLTLAF
jgi:hypothetical protein